MPSLVTRYVNGHLETMGGYRGHVDDIDISLLRGAYSLHDLIIIKRSASAEQPFIVLPLTDISVEWSALLKGELVGEIQMHGPAVNLVQGESEKETQLGTGVNWPDQVRELFPFRFNRIEATDGNVTFRAPGIKTDQSLTLSNVQLVVANLTNARELENPVFADFEVSGRFAENTPLSIKGHADPNADQATFDVNMSLEDAELVDINPWLEELLNVDAEKGSFSMYAEVAAADGRFEGYVKPILEDAEIFRLDEPSSGPLQKLWEGLVGLVSAILTNQEADQVATQVPFSGELDSPDAGVMATVVNLLRNAFVAAFSHSLEGTVSIEDVDAEAEADESAETE